MPEKGQTLRSGALCSFCEGGTLGLSPSGKNQICTKCGRVAVSKGARGKGAINPERPCPFPLRRRVATDPTCRMPRCRAPCPTSDSLALTLPPSIGPAVLQLALFCGNPAFEMQHCMNP